MNMKKKMILFVTMGLIFAATAFGYYHINEKYPRAIMKEAALGEKLE